MYIQINVTIPAFRTETRHDATVSNNKGKTGPLPGDTVNATTNSSPPPPPPNQRNGIKESCYLHTRLSKYRQTYMVSVVQQSYFVILKTFKLVSIPERNWVASSLTAGYTQTQYYLENL
jgi:hypothetical protein